MKTVEFINPTALTPQAKRVVDIMVRDGGITHLRAMHYNIGSITKELTRIRDAMPVGYKVARVTRKDADDHKYSHWMFARVV